MNNPGAEKLKMLQASVRCLVYGLLALLPLIGLPFALAALWLAGRIRKQEKVYWNAAKPYRVIGTLCAAIGTLGWCLIAFLFALNGIAHNGGY
jgi:hypothetical protein